MVETANWLEMIDSEFRELADNAPVMIWRARTDKQCDWFNKPWLDFAGKTQEQLFGYGWAADVHPEDYDRCVQTYVEAFDARETFTMPYRLKRSDGVYRWLLDNGAPFYRNGAFAGYYGSCIDITTQRELEDHQRTLLAELNHRVKNNLQLILSFLQLSKIRAVTEEAKVLLDGAMSRIRGVATIQDELYKNADGTVELGQYLTNLARSLLKIDETRKISLVTKTDLIRVPFELGSNLGLIVNELVTNSLKHGGELMSTVSLTVIYEGGERVLISVSDDGAGFNGIGESVSIEASRKGADLVSALTKRVRGTLTRTNESGACITLVCPLRQHS